MDIFSLDGSAACKPFHYKKRFTDVKLVNKKKIELAKKHVKMSTARSNLTSYISSLKSHQEAEPWAGEYIDYTVCEPLHLKITVLRKFL